MNAHYEKGRILYNQKRAKLAEEEFRKALAEEPHNFHAHAMLGSCLNAQERYDEALSEAQEAVRLNPRDSYCHYILGHTLIRMGFVDRGTQAVKDAIGLRPEARHFSLLAEVEQNKENWGEMLRLAEEGLRLEPEHIESLILRAGALARVERKNESLECFKVALRLEPENSEVHAALGYMLFQECDDDAKHHLREALRLDPEENWFCHYVLESIDGRNPFAQFLYLNGMHLIKTRADQQMNKDVGTKFELSMLYELPLAAFCLPAHLLLVCSQAATSPQGRKHLMRAFNRIKRHTFP